VEKFYIKVKTVPWKIYTINVRKMVREIYTINVRKMVRKIFVKMIITCVENSLCILNKIYP